MCDQICAEKVRFSLRKYTNITKLRISNRFNFKALKSVTYPIAPNNFFKLKFNNWQIWKWNVKHKHKPLHLFKLQFHNIGIIFMIAIHFEDMIFINWYLSTWICNCYILKCAVYRITWFDKYITVLLKNILCLSTWLGLEKDWWLKLNVYISFYSQSLSYDHFCYFSPHNK